MSWIAAMMSLILARADLAAESAGARGPQESETGGAEPGDREADGGEDAAVQELAAGDAELLLVDRLPRSRRRRARAWPARSRRWRAVSSARSRPVVSRSVDDDASETAAGSVDESRWRVSRDSAPVERPRRFARTMTVAMPTAMIMMIGMATATDDDS